jgi:hypothetical protein
MKSVLRPADRLRHCRTAAARLCSVFCLLTLWTTQAHAGNYEGILVGSQAALTGGAVTATVGDGSAAWYNPAGLARIDKQSFNVNASVYGIGLFSADQFATIDGEPSQEAQTTDWQLIPSVLSYARALSPTLVAAFSIIIPRTTDYDLRTSVQTQDGSRWSLGIDTLANEYDYIVSLGWRLTRDLRLGASLHGIYLSTEHVMQLARGQPGVDGTPFATFSNHTKFGDYGLRLGLGLQWTVSPRFDLGLSLQTPTLTGFRSTFKTSTQSAVHEGSASEFDLDEEDDTKSVWELSTPLVVRLGAAYKLGRVQVLADGSLYTPLNSSERALDRKLTGNARLGCLVEASELFAFGVGAFTDLNGSRAGATLDYVGVSGGVQLAKRYPLAEGGRTIVVVTTLSGRYAYGWGHANGVAFEGESPSAYTLTSVPMTAHELALNLASGVSF